MTDGTPLRLPQLCEPRQVEPGFADELIDCWVEVSNAGGAVGFPFPPVTVGDVRPDAERLVAGLDPRRSRLVLAVADAALAGWLNIRRDPHPLVAHWGTLHHVQTRPGHRGRGVGAALVNRARVVGRDEMGLEQLHLAARSGMGLEDFYGRLGFKEIGRREGAYRLGPGDDRDEILMALAPL